MRDFLSLVKWDVTGRVEKFQDFDTLEAAQGHAASCLARFPDAFAAANPGGEFMDWLVDGVQKTVFNSPRVAAIEVLRSRKLAQVQAIYDGKIAAGRKYTDTKTYPLTPKHRETLMSFRVALLAGEVNPHDGYFTDIRGAKQAFDDAGLAALALDIGQYIWALNRAKIDHDAAVAAEADYETLQLYDCTTGWPVNGG